MSERLRSAAGKALSLVLVLGLVVVLRGWVYETHLHVTGQRQVGTVSLTAGEVAAAGSMRSISSAIPVLTFHDISDVPGPYTVQPHVFAREMAALDAAGFQTVRLGDVADLAAGRPVTLPPKPVLITFDDGFATTWTVADPILAAHHFTAVAFVITGSLLPGFTVSSELDDEEVRTMSHSGRWEFGGHTDKLHIRRPTADGTAEPALVNRLLLTDGRTESLEQWRARVASDLRASQRRIRRLTGARAMAFAFPYGASDRPVNDARIPGEVNRLLTANGYQLAFNAENAVGGGGIQLLAVQPGQDALRLPRLGVTADESPLDVLTVLQSVRPQPLPHALAEVSWQASGGTCVVGPRNQLRLTTSDYVQCIAVAQSQSWHDYQLDVDVRGVSPDCTALVSVREAHTVLRRGRLEVALGASRVRVRSYTADRHAELLRQELTTGSARRSAATRHLRLTVVGTSLTVEVDGRRVGTVATGSNTAGAPYLAAACHGPAHQLTVTASSLAPLPASPRP